MDRGRESPTLSKQDYSQIYLPWEKEDTVRKIPGGVSRDSHLGGRDRSSGESRIAEEAGKEEATPREEEDPHTGRFRRSFAVSHKREYLLCPRGGE